MKKRVYDKRLLVATKMPPLKRKASSFDAYDPQKDEVAQWLAQQPDVLSYLVDLIRRLGYINFDPNTHTWKGSDFE